MVRGPDCRLKLCQTTNRPENLQVANTGDVRTPRNPSPTNGKLSNLVEPGAASYLTATTERAISSVG